MHDNSTRSGMLWEVERILSELWVDGKPLPQILLMENVPGVCGTGVIDDFNKWLNRLEQFGYINKYKIINATDFGIPQNRKRCFMVSILGDYYFEFPDEIPLEIRMKHILEKRVAKRYYLSDKTVESFIAETTKHQERGNGFKFSSVNIDGESHSITTKSGQRATDNFISENSQFVNVERERERERAVKLAKSGTIIKDNAEQIALTITAHDGNGLTGFAKQYNNGVAEMLTDAHWEKQ